MRIAVLPFIVECGSWVLGVSFVVQDRSHPARTVSTVVQQASCRHSAPMRPQRLRSAEAISGFAFQCRGQDGRIVEAIEGKWQHCRRLWLGSAFLALCLGVAQSDCENRTSRCYGCRQEVAPVGRKVCLAFCFLRFRVCNIEACSLPACSNPMLRISRYGFQGLENNL